MALESQCTLVLHVDFLSKGDLVGSVVLSCLGLGLCLAALGFLLQLSQSFCADAGLERRPSCPFRFSRLCLLGAFLLLLALLDSPDLGLLPDGEYLLWGRMA